MRILIAGGTGVLGRAAVPMLVAEGHRVMAVSRRVQTDEWLEDVGAHPVNLDVFDALTIARAAEGADVVINVATSIPSSPFPPSAWETNDRLRRDASAALAAAATTVGAAFVQESFAAALADGGDRWLDEQAPMAPIDGSRTVIDAEQSAASVTAAGGRGVALRFGLFHGPSSSMTRQLVQLSQRGWLGLPGPEDRYVSLVDVEDAARAVVASLTLPAGVYNVVEPSPATVRTHATALAQILGRKVRPLPRAIGHIPYLRVMGRSQRISSAKLQATEWAPTIVTAHERWSRAIARASAPVSMSPAADTP